MGCPLLTHPGSADFRDRFLFTVDADTEVTPDSLNRLVSAASDDARIIGICGETKLSNEKTSWWTMIQVYECVPFSLGARGRDLIVLADTTSRIIFRRRSSPSLEVLLVYQAVSRSIESGQPTKAVHLSCRIWSLTIIPKFTWM